MMHVLVPYLCYLWPLLVIPLLAMPLLVKCLLVMLLLVNCLLLIPELVIHLLVLYLYLRCLGLDSKYQVLEQYTNTKAQVNDNWIMPHEWNCAAIYKALSSQSEYTCMFFETNLNILEHFVGTYQPKIWKNKTNIGKKHIKKHANH